MNADKPTETVPSQSTREAITRLATMLGESLEPGWDIDDTRISIIIDRATAQVPLKHEAQRRALKAEETLRAALDSRQHAGWRPIETAPRDGTHILCYEPHPIAAEYYRASFDELYGWCNHRRGMMNPTAWQPLPEPPDESLPER